LAEFADGTEQPFFARAREKGARWPTLLMPIKNGRWRASRRRPDCSFYAVFSGKARAVNADEKVI
jgi:hypothetical protein